MYGSDLGRAERAYYTPPEYAEGEYEGTRSLYCRNEDCADFEFEVDVDVVVSYCGSTGTAIYTCHRCGQDSDHEFALDDSEIGGVYDTDEDWRHDK